MTPMDSHALQAVFAEIEALYEVRGARNFTAVEQIRYDSLLVTERLIRSP
jgi:hypothetical protein